MRCETLPLSFFSTCFSYILLFCFLLLLLKRTPKASHPQVSRGLPLPRLILRTCDTYSLFRLLLLGFGYCLRVSWLFWCLCLTSSVSLTGPLHSSKESQRKKTLFVLSHFIQGKSTSSNQISYWIITPFLNI